MPEHKEGEEDKEVDIKPTKGNVSEEYLKGYRVGYNRAIKRIKRNKLEIQVKKDQPITRGKEVKKEEVKTANPSFSATLRIIGVSISFKLSDSMSSSMSFCLSSSLQSFDKNRKTLFTTPLIGRTTSFFSSLSCGCSSASELLSLII